jgi:serine/threonine protein phosphatase PrpC
MTDSSIATYPANHPIEDRHVTFRISDKVTAATVFDGHGGWQCAEFAVSSTMNDFASVVGFWPDLCGQLR